MRWRARVLKEIPALRLADKQLGPFVAGQEVELEPWEVVALERHGMVEAIPKLIPVEMRKLMLAEERAEGLAKLPEGFYSLLAERISSSLSSGKPEEAEELRTMAGTIVELRMRKLLLFALSPESAENALPEERFLINRLASSLEEWEGWLGGVLKEAGEEVGKSELGEPVRHAAGEEAGIQKPRVPAPEVHA